MEASSLATDFEKIKLLGDKFLSLLKSKDILDYGCGKGEFSWYFKNKGFRVFSADDNEENVKECIKKGLRCRLMDLSYPDFSPCFYDGIWAFNSLSKTSKKDIKSRIWKLGEALKSEGVMMLAMPECIGENNYSEEEIRNIFKPRYNVLEFTRLKVNNENMFVFIARTSFKI